jgi:hypothetical protein
MIHSTASNPMITATKIKRTWFLQAGEATLPGRFKTETQALEALAANPGFYRYWAESVGTSVLNTTPVVVEA